MLTIRVVVRCEGIERLNSTNQSEHIRQCLHALGYHDPFLIRPKVRIKCLIGRDILKHSVLIYNGHSNMFSLDFKG